MFEEKWKVRKYIKWQHWNYQKIVSFIIQNVFIIIIIAI